jgi:hypothetical protein
VLRSSCLLLPCLVQFASKPSYFSNQREKRDGSRRLACFGASALPTSSALAAVALTLERRFIASAVAGLHDQLLKS